MDYGLEIFLFTTTSRQALGLTQPPTQWVPGAPSPGVKQLGCEADQSPPYSAKVKNAQSYTSIPPIPLHGIVFAAAVIMSNPLTAVASLLLCGIGTVVANQCSVDTPVKFSLISRRNQTGHWVAQVQLEHGTRSEHKKMQPLEVDVEHSVFKCSLGEDTIQIRATITAPSVHVGPGYELFPGVGYYKFHSKSATWNDAWNICTQEGAHLAIVNSEAESKVLKEIFSRFPKLQDVTYNDFAFIGFHDLYKEGVYLTIYDKPLSSTGFTQWAGGQPDDAGGNEDCGSVHRSGTLNDLICSKKHAFICEQEL